LEEYLKEYERQQKFESIEAIYQRFLEAAINANMTPSVILGGIGKVENLGVVLYNFHPASVIEKYSSNWDVLDEIERCLKPRGEIRRTPRSIWPRYCRTILSAANFLLHFDSAGEFYEWIDIFNKDEITRPALALLIGCEVYGFGFVLACDFIKDLGYKEFAKPDVQIKNIFTGLELCPPKAGDYQVFKAIVRLAKNVGVPPYTADKLFWLVGSGNFYNDKQIGKEGRIPTRKEEFIADALTKLQE
jgi:hypothetical protein